MTAQQAVMAAFLAFHSRHQECQDAVAYYMMLDLAEAANIDLPDQPPVAESLLNTHRSPSKAVSLVNVNEVPTQAPFEPIIVFVDDQRHSLVAGWYQQDRWMDVWDNRTDLTPPIHSFVIESHLVVI